MKTLLRGLNFFFLIVSFMFTGVCGAAVPEAVPNVPAPDLASDTFSQENTAPAPAAVPENGEWSKNKVIGQQDLQIICGTSHVLSLNREVGRIAISEPDVADVAVINKHEILISTKKRGAANLLVWDKSGDIYAYNLSVVGDPTVLKSALEKIAPQNKVEVFSTEKGYVVRGNVDTVEMQKQIADTSKAFSTDSVSIVTVNEAKQILLEIRVIEIDRSKSNEFGVDGALLAEKFGLTFIPGGLGPVNAIASEAGKDIILGLPKAGMKSNFTANYHSKNFSASTILRALENESFTKVLARPNILVRDGSQAHFLVGGEVPIPTVTQNTTDVTYKEFGTKLTYTPAILGNGMIRFEIETEVSELDQANGIQSNGFNIPAITSRKAQTTVEIDNESTLVIGGMIQDRISRVDSGTPFLRRVPLLGKLFSNTNSQHASVELVIFITPHIVDPKKEGFDLRKIKKSDPRFTVNELPNPPFEDAKALAMEEYLTRFENEREASLGISDRKLKRDAWYKQYLETQRKLREKEAAKAEKKAKKQEAKKGKA